MLSWKYLFSIPEQSDTESRFLNDHTLKPIQIELANCQMLVIKKDTRLCGFPGMVKLHNMAIPHGEVGFTDASPLLPCTTQSRNGEKSGKLR
jgi:hypothetical protein